MSCQIKRNSDGQIEQVYAKNGVRSALFERLAAVTKDNDTAARMWAIANEEPTQRKMGNPRLDENGEPDVSFEEVAAVITSFKRPHKDDTKKLEKALEGFLRSLNLNVKTVESVKELTGYSAISTTDLLYKTVLINNTSDYINSLTRETAYVAYSFLGRNNKIKTDLTSSVVNLPHYNTILNDYKKKFPNYNDYTINSFIVIDLIADAIKNNFKTPKDSYIHRKADYWALKSTSYLGKKLEILLIQIKKLLQKIIKKKPLTTEEFTALIDDIANDVVTNTINDKYAKSIKSGQQQVFYEQTIASDIKAKEIVEYLQSLGLMLTGSLALRKQGTVYRTSDETIHDLDFTVPIDILTEKDFSLVNVMFEYKVGLRGIIEQLDVIKEIKKVYPNFKYKLIIKSDKRDSISVGAAIGNYAIDLFFRKQTIQEIQSEPGIQKWQSIFAAKLQMGRKKDLNDFINYTPFAPEPGILYSQEQGLRHFTFPDVEIKSIEEQFLSPEEREKLLRLRKSLNADIVLDPNTEEAFVEAYNPETDERPVIHIPVGLIQQDDLIHEHGHIYIDLRGGMKDPFVRKGREQLKGSAAERYVDLNRPDLIGEARDKEILAVAIGWEGTNLFEKGNTKSLEGWRRWLQIFLNRIKRLLGLERNVAQALAKDMLNNTIRKKDLVGQVSGYRQYNKAKKTTIDLKPLTVQLSNLERLKAGKKTISLRTDADINQPGYVNYAPGDILMVVTEKTRQNIFVRVKNVVRIQKGKFPFLSLERRDNFARKIGAYSDYANYRTNNPYLDPNDKRAQAFPSILKFVKGEIGGNIIEYELYDPTEKEKRLLRLNSQMDELYKIKQEAIDVVHKKLMLLRKRDKMRDRTGKKTPEYEENLEILLQTLKNEADYIGLIKLLRLLHNQTINLDTKLQRAEARRRADKKLNPDNPNLGKYLNLRVLNSVRNYVISFDKLMEDLVVFLDKERGRKSGFGSEIKPLSKKRRKHPDIGHSLFDYASIIKGMKDSILRKYTYLAREELSRGMGVQSTRITALYKDNFIKEFKKNNKRKGSKYFLGDRQVKRDEWEEELAAYVNERLAENRKNIYDDSVEFFREELTLASYDISGFVDYFFIDAKNQNDPLIQMLALKIDEAERQSRQQYNEIFVNYGKAYTNLLKYSESKGWDVTKLYDVFWEKTKDGEYTHNLVTEYYSEYLKEKQKVYDELPSLTPAEQKAVWKKFRLEHQTTEEVTIKGKKITIPKIAEKYKNPIYDKIQKNPQLLEFYEATVALIEEMDALLPWSYRLRRIDSATKDVFITMPYMRKDLVDRLSEGQFNNPSSAAKAVKDMAIEMSSLVEDDPDYGEIVDGEFRTDLKKVLIDESGKVKRFIPIFYRVPIVNPNNTSRDIARLMLANAYTSLNYSEKNKILAEVEAARNLAKERRVRRTSGLKSLVDAMLLKEANKEGVDSNSFKYIEALMEDRLFGIKSTFESEITLYGNTFKLDKIANAFMAYTGTVMLSMNYLASGANFLLGESMLIIEAAGGEHFEKDALMKAHMSYFGGSDYSQMIGDFGMGIYRSKTNLLMVEYDALNDYSHQKRKMGPRLRNMIDMNTLHIMNNMVEHYLQNMVMYAVLHNTKVFDANNKPILKKNGKHMSLADAYSVVEEDGIHKLKLDDRVAYTSKNRQTKFDDAQKGQLEWLMKDINQDLHGAYSDTNRALAQRALLGKAAFMLRKWIVPGMLRRFRGLTKLTEKGIRKIRGEDSSGVHKALWTHYSEHAQAWKEGIYVSLLSFLGRLMSDLNSLRKGTDGKKSLWETWDETTPLERANIQRSVFDIGFMIVSFYLATLLKEIGDDEDEKVQKRYYLAAFYANRLYTELRFYTHPEQALLILKTPAATVSMISRIFEFTEQLRSDMFHGFSWERYETGKRAGTAKIRKDLIDLLPFYKQVSRYSTIDEALQYFYKDRGR